MKQFGKVIVLMGGDNAEHEVSLKSGQRVLNALQENNIDAHGLVMTPHYVNDLIELQPDRVFLALHGKGTDGSLR